VGDGTDTVVIREESPAVTYKLLSAGYQRPLSVLLDENRNELPGAAIFTSVEGWEPYQDVATEILPGARLSHQVTSDEAPKLPESTLLVYDPDTRQYILKNWYKPWVIEQLDEVITVTFATRPVFTRISEYIDGDNGKTYAIFIADLSWGSVLEQRSLAPSLAGNQAAI